MIDINKLTEALKSALDIEDTAIDSIEELEEYLDEYGADFLSDEFDFCINSFDFEIVEDRWQVNWMKDGCFEIYTKYED